MNRIVLDTGVFFQPAALQAVRKSAATVVIPTVVLAERVRHLAKNGIPRERFLSHLQMLEFAVEPLGIIEALRYTRELGNDEQWKASSRDALIAGHVRRGDELWTTNAKHFRLIGVPDEQVVDTMQTFGLDRPAART